MIQSSRGQANGPGVRSVRRQLQLVAIAVLVFASSTTAGLRIQYISPLPGSQLVSQRAPILVGFGTHVSLPTNTSAQLVSVWGSTSGTHTGSLTLSDDGKVLIFKPDRSFAPGEEVPVRMSPGVSDGAGSSSESLEFRFSVSPLSSADQKELLRNSLLLQGTRNALRRPATLSSISQAQQREAGTYPEDLPIPVVTRSDQPTDGLMLLATWKEDASPVNIQFDSSGHQYLMIVDNTGKPVSYKKVTSLTTDFKVQPNGNLTYFDSRNGCFYELDNTLAVIDSFACGGGYQTDVYELLLLPNGHALLLGLDPQFVNMSQVIPGAYPDATVIGAVIQELDANKNVVFEWRTFDHFHITDATHEDLRAQTIDYVHANALELDTDGEMTDTRGRRISDVVLQVPSLPSSVPSSLVLSQNSPNPFNPATTIQFSLPRQANVSLDVYDVLGREIATLISGVLAPGTYTERFDASRIASGVYYYVLTSEGVRITKAMTLLR